MSSMIRFSVQVKCSIFPVIFVRNSCNKSIAINSGLSSVCMVAKEKTLSSVYLKCVHVLSFNRYSTSR